MTGHTVIEAGGIHKSYGSLRILHDLDLAVAAGSVYALLGPNGAGKTTTVRILVTLTHPDGGYARVDGFDVVRQRSQARRRLGLVGQSVSVDETLTGRENLRMAARFAGIPRGPAARRVGELVGAFDLAPVADRRATTYSGGLRRRLDLAVCLVRRPAVLFLDEPTTGLDPRSRQQLWAVLSDLVATGTTLFLTTQYLEEADRLADRVGVLDGGRMVAEGTPAELKARVPGRRLELTAADPTSFAGLLDRAGPRATGVDESRLTLGVATDGTANDVRGLLDALDPDRRLAGFSVRSASLDDVFLHLTGTAPDTTRTGPEVTGLTEAADRNPVRT